MPDDILGHFLIEQIRERRRKSRKRMQKIKVFHIITDNYSTRFEVFNYTESKCHKKKKKKSRTIFIDKVKISSRRKEYTLRNRTFHEPTNIPSRSKTFLIERDEKSPKNPGLLTLDGSIGKICKRDGSNVNEGERDDRDKRVARTGGIFRWSIPPGEFGWSPLAADPTKVGRSVTKWAPVPRTDIDLVSRWINREIRLILIAMRWNCTYIYIYIYIHRTSRHTEPINPFQLTSSERITRGNLKTKVTPSDLWIRVSFDGTILRVVVYLFGEINSKFLSLSLSLARNCICVGEQLRKIHREIYESEEINRSIERVLFCTIEESVVSVSKW